ncbi:MAG TPA: 16S rRNA (cytidine(1402)-2'-O)-methyltransferase, partial [Micromonosporaceae bacterium]|nr:16S rRNA (cytidine(1402)-2'-O)-methyltransferase [Micromonosporaceae bacterium]
DRSAAVCRELTKTYEEVVRRPLGDLAAWAAADQPRGEITLVVAGAAAVPPVRPSDEQLRAAVAELEAAGRSRRDAIVAVTEAYGLRRRDVYTVVHAPA